MFRQRLKGGHRVGANSKVTSTPQNVDLNSPSLPQVSSQDWYPQTPYGNIEVSGNVKTSDISKSSGYHHSTQNAQPQSTKHYQYGSQMQNGSNPQNQGQDAWNWGSEDNWNDWGNSDSYYINANNNNNQPTTSYEDQSFISEDQSGAFSAQSTAQISNTVETNNNVPLHYSEATSSCKVENISDHSQTLDKDYGSVHIHNTLRNNSSHDLNEIAASYDTETTEAIFNHPKEDNSQYSQTVPDFNENSQFSRIQTFFKSDEKDIDISVPDIHSSLNIETTSEAVYNTSTSSVNNFSYGQANPQHNNSCLLKDNEQKLENENKSDNWEDAEFNETSANDKETTLANDNENRSYLDMMQGLALNNERLENLEANSIAESSENVQTVSQFPQNHNSQGLENLELINIAESFEDVQANIQLPQDQDSHENNTGTSNEASLPQVPSWDDEWGDGWETKPLSCQGSESSLEQSENNTETSNSFPVVESLNQSDMKGSDSNDTFEFTVKDSVKDEYEKDWEVSTNPTNQFPEVSNIQVLDQELHGIFSGPTEATLVVSGDVHDDHLLPTFSFKEKLDVIKVDDLSIKGIPNKDKESASVDSTKMDNLSTKNTEIIDEVAQYLIIPTILSILLSGTSNVIIQKPVAFPSEAPSQKLSTRSCPASVLQDNFESEDKERMPSDQDSFPEKLEDKFCVPNIAQSVPGPSGNIPNLQARKGSPFQPPAYKRTTVVHQSRNAETKILSSHPSILQSNSNPITPLQENTILLNSQPPESNVKLQVVHNSFQNRNLGEADLNRPLVVSERDETTNSAYFDQILPAHFSSMQSKLEQPKVRTLETMNDTPTSPSVLDLSQLSIKKERDNDSPAFKRMVPGESTKGESAPTLGYQIPVIVPAMPSGRVVTGNDNPQPIPSVRVKQEHGEIRAPPDGPDTGVLQDESPGVIPPIRSETMMIVIVKGKGGKDGKRDYYIDRHSERKRNEGSFYSHDSPQRSNKQRDIDYDPFYGERHYNRRPLRDDDYDDEEEDGDERKYLQNMRERRRRAYRDELERYGGRERQYGREKRRNRDRDGRYLLEDEDFYEAPSSDRSRPSSRSSSFGNADSETGAGSHLSHLDDYYDPRYAKPRDKPREKGYRDPYREYPPYKKREDKEKDPYDGKGKILSLK
ncbi:hypothetical protein Avbf_00203 [Armadillidium vulgare]|nr:hypothetical protein Avbf_00203 [Armadillidium vulgare]